jgi:hypothetical protein
MDFLKSMGLFNLAALAAAAYPLFATDAVSPRAERTDTLASIFTTAKWTFKIFSSMAGSFY